MPGLLQIEEVMSVKSIREQDGKAFCFTGTNAVQNLQQGQQRGAGSRQVPLKPWPAESVDRLD